MTGIRKDAFAQANRIPVEVDKLDGERGLYLHPEAFGLEEEKSIHFEHNQKMERERQRMENEE